MTELVTLFERAVEQFGSRVHGVTADQWTAPTPNTEWDVRMLVNHVVGEDRWAPALLHGQTIAEVGDRFDGDLLGDEPLDAWQSASADAVASAAEDGALDRTVHVSFGDIPGAEYLSQLVCDHVIHAWDLARATGGDETLDPDLVAWAHAFITPQAEAWRAAGAFGPKVDVPDGADLQTQLLAITGRQR
jgi:uncharacterized protein (TIGR03086 family)